MAPLQITSWRRQRTGKRLWGQCVDMSCFRGETTRSSDPWNTGEGGGSDEDGRQKKAVLLRDKYLALVICFLLLFGVGFTELL